MAQAISYTPPRLYSGKEWYVGFYAYDPIHEKLRIKRIKLNYIPNKIERRKFACDLIKRLSDKLRRGLNPWIAAETNKGYCTFKDACDYYIDKGNCARTRDNYLGWLKSFCSFLVQSGYHKERVTDGIETFSKWQKKKNREYIPEDILMKVKKQAEEKNKHFLLATYILFYSFIRPSEMSKLKISNINLKNRTIIIDEEQSKNRRKAAVTLPVKVIHLMLDLKIFDYPGNYFLFSEKMRPGMEYADSKQFRDFWNHHIRKPLNLSEKYKFYSLKDTGVTMMLRANMDILSVRDQARHSSILITDTYTPHDIVVANPLIDKFKCEF